MSTWAAEARAAGLARRPTTLVTFGNPVAGNRVMATAPQAALDLPLEILIRADGGMTKVSYFTPSALAARHQLDPAVAESLAGSIPLPMHSSLREAAFGKTSTPQSDARGRSGAHHGDPGTARRESHRRLDDRRRRPRQLVGGDGRPVGNLATMAIRATPSPSPSPPQDWAG